MIISIIMYIYFKYENAVISCDEYPEVFSVDLVKNLGLENRFNKWEKKDNEDGTFTLSYKFEKKTCNCDNSPYEHITDYHLYECYNCCRLITPPFEEGTDLYLQNSGHMDILCANSQQKFCQLIEVIGYPNIYKWTESSSPENIFALHLTKHYFEPKEMFKEYFSDEDILQLRMADQLSDSNIKDKISDEEMQKSCHIIFTEYI